MQIYIRTHGCRLNAAESRWIEEEFMAEGHQIVDSIGKKIKAVEEVVHVLGLKNITCCHCRVELLPSRFDVIVGRAVTNWADFQNLAVPKLRHNGTILYLSGGEIKTDDTVEKVDLFEMFNRRYCETKILLVKKMKAQKNPSKGPFKQ